MTTLAELRAALPAYPIEVNFPDLQRWRDSNTGIDYVHTRDSGVPGPHVLILALMHGNEVSGAIAVDSLLKRALQPTRGRLSFAFANTAAYERFDSSEPDASRFVDEDLNRVWSDSTLASSRDSVELRRARALRPFIDTVDYLLDIHSMHEAAAPVMMCGPLEKGRNFALALGYPAHIIVDAGHADGRRLRDYGDFGDPRSDRNALLIETGQHFARCASDVALATAARFMQHTGVLDSAALLDWLPAALPSRPELIEITQPVIARSMAMQFAQPWRGLERIAKKDTLIASDGTEEVRTPYDDCVIVQPSLRQLSPGVTVMRLGKYLAV